MKSNGLLSRRLFGAAALVLATTGILVFSGCEKTDPAEDAASNTGSIDIAQRPVDKNSIVLPFFVEGAGQEWWANLSDNDNLYEKRTHSQLFGPDGHPVTWGEFNAVSGSAKINCTGQGTRINMSVSGLIPNGVYSLWCMTFTPPGFDTAYTNVSGFGAAGAADGSGNVFIASSRGDARLHVLCKAGPLSVSGSIGGCIPVDEYELHFVAIYHNDQKPHGSTPGPVGSYVEQFAFTVVNH
jgi:hypothetical protein